MDADTVAAEPALALAAAVGLAAEDVACVWVDRNIPGEFSISNGTYTRSPPEAVFRMRHAVAVGALCFAAAIAVWLGNGRGRDDTSGEIGTSNAPGDGTRSRMWTPCPLSILVLQGRVARLIAVAGGAIAPEAIVGGTPCG